MKKILLIAFLINVYGCAVIPYEAPTSCFDAAGNGVACAMVEENLNYSVGKDSKTVVTPKKETTESGETEEISQEVTYDREQVTKDELTRIVTEMSIDIASTSKAPAYIAPKTYKVLVFPYASGDKYYSARYVYITAGKPRWVTGSYVTGEGQKPIKIDTSNIKPVKPTQGVYVGEMKEVSTTSKPITTKPKAVHTQSNEPVATRNSPVDYIVGAYYLNCRDMPSLDGYVMTVFDKDTQVEIIDNSHETWWQVGYKDYACYVHRAYLERK